MIVYITIWALTTLWIISTAWHLAEDWIDRFTIALCSFGLGFLWWLYIPLSFVAAMQDLQVRREHGETADFRTFVATFLNRDDR